VLTNDPDKLARWKEWFEALLKKPTITSDPVIFESSHNSVVDKGIFIDLPSPTDFISAMKRIMFGRAAGILRHYSRATQAIWQYGYGSTAVTFQGVLGI